MPWCSFDNSFIVCVHFLNIMNKFAVIMLYEIIYKEENQRLGCNVAFSAAGTQLSETVKELIGFS